MSKPNRVAEQDISHFNTTTIVGWVDVFSRKNYRDVIVESLNFCSEKKGLQIRVWVIMSNHIHLIARDAGSNLSGIIRDFKSFTAGKILNLIQTEPESRREWMMIVFGYHGKGSRNNEHFQFWQPYHAETLRTAKFTLQKINYLHHNPVRNGLVANPEDYLYSSARDYAGTAGLVKLQMFEPIDLYEL